MKSSTFWRTVVCGLLATFVMGMIAFFQGGFGIPVIDVGHILKASFNQVHIGEPYTIVWGNIAYFIIGVILSLIYVAFIQVRLPKNWLLNGVIYGLIISFVAGFIVAPIAGMATGQEFGLFYFDTWFPMLVLIGALIMHIGYGIALALCLKVAGVYGMNGE